MKICKAPFSTYELLKGAFQVHTLKQVQMLTEKYTKSFNIVLDTNT